MAKFITFNGTHKELQRLLYAFIGSISGRTGAYAPYVRGIKLRVGMVALKCIQEAFIEKASGGVGSDGVQWVPLKKETIASRRIGAGDVLPLKNLGITKRKFGYGARKQSGRDLDIKGRLKRAFLTDAQDRRWRLIFATRKRQMMAQFGMSDEASSARAAQIAWSMLKAEGAKTKLEVLGNRSVQIGRDTGRLFASLSPGITNPESSPLTAEPEVGEDTILREEPGGVIVGTNVEYASSFHAKRPLWPLNNQLPNSWQRQVDDAAGSGISEAIGMILGSQ